MSLQVAFDANGISNIFYNGQSLLAGPFTIWEFRTLDATGKPVMGLWGESAATGKSWNPATQTITWTFPWGTVVAKYTVSATVSADLLRVDIMVSNTDPAITVEGLTIIPCTLKFPSLPAGFKDPSFPQLTDEGPGVVAADWGMGMVACVNENAGDKKPVIRTGFDTNGQNVNLLYRVTARTTWNTGETTFTNRFTRPVGPGSTDSFALTLRFSASGTDLATLCASAYANYQAAYPYGVNWPDRRPIGFVSLSSCVVSDDITNPHTVSATNLRNWWNDPAVDVTTPAGVAAFQGRMLTQADSIVTQLKACNSQGFIFWDMEGQRFPQPTSYVGDPSQLATLAPEMDTIADAFFSKIKAAGFKIGCCLRPQNFTLNQNGSASQVYVDAVNAGLPQNQLWPVGEQQIEDAVVTLLSRKITYCVNRWGMSMFYVDTCVNVNGGVLAAAIWRRLNAAFPNILFAPEQKIPATAGYTAPYSQAASTSGYSATPAEFKRTYPPTFSVIYQAFSVIYICDTPVNTDGSLAMAPQFVQAVKNGDILMSRQWYNDSQYNSQLPVIYATAGIVSPPPSTANWSATGLPAGLTLSASGLLTGMVTTAGVYTFGVSMTDQQGTVQGQVTLTVTDPPPPPPPTQTRSISPGTVSAVAGQPINQQFSVVVK